MKLAQARGCVLAACGVAGLAVNEHAARLVKKAVTGTGAPQGVRSQGVNGAFLAAITPESETSCHYFWNFVRTFRTDDECS